MRKIIVTVHIKDILFSLMIIIAFIILASIIIVGKTDKAANPNKENIDINKKQVNNNVVENSGIVVNPEIELYVTKEDRIIKMNLEEYLVGVVSAEMPANFEVEALKAQAVAARTYALSHVESAGGIKCSKGKGADLCDTVHCQAYISKEERFSKWPENKGEEYWNKISEAVKETRGKVLTYNNDLVKEPFYFSTSGGKTENAEDVFSGSAPYLKSVESPGEDRAPKYSSEFTFSKSELVKIINNNYPSAKVTVNNIDKEIKIISRSDGGSVKEIKVGNATITGLKFRYMLNLTSANFQLSFNKDILSISCKGYGHGVGMSQWGADTMAKNGDNYEDILKHYYSGVDIERVKYSK